MDSRDIVIVEGEYMCFPDGMHFDSSDLWVLRGAEGTFKCYTNEEYKMLGEELLKLYGSNNSFWIRKVFATTILVTLENNRFFLSDILRYHATSEKYLAIRKEGYLLLEPVE